MFAQFDSIVLPPIHDNKKLFLPLPQPQSQPGTQVNVAPTLSAQSSQQQVQVQQQQQQQQIQQQVQAQQHYNDSGNLQLEQTASPSSSSRNIGQPVNVHYIHHHHYHHDPLANPTSEVKHDSLQSYIPSYKKDILVHPNPILPPLKQQQLQHQSQHLDYASLSSSTGSLNSLASTPLSTLTSLGQTPSPDISRGYPNNNYNMVNAHIPVNDVNLNSNKVTKPRKKKQCPDCHLFFSNLSTHKSTHLSPQNRPFKCHVCKRGFSRSNDLYRHEKRHWKETGSDEGAYKCPFNSVLLSDDEKRKLPTNILPCHSTGIFSRCDTYKNHLKALHFEYPLGTKKKMRNGVSGNCKLCGKSFNNVDEWLATHVETGDCHL